MITSEVVNRMASFDKCVKRGKVVFVRVDINSPISGGKIADEFRIKAHSHTLRAASDAGARVVVLAHQGRPGQDDFTSLELHKPYLEKYVGKPIKFVDDVIGPEARRQIKELGDGEILLLENVRVLSEELIERVPEAQAKTTLIRKLAPLGDYFVLDGFAVAHRSQPSVVGFPVVMPSCMGPVFERELRALSTVFEQHGRGTLLIAGGAKVPETLKAIERLLASGLVERVAVGGLVGVVFAAAKYAVGGALRHELERLGLLSHVEKARQLLEKHRDKIHVPLDFAVDHNGRMEVDVHSLVKAPLDVGRATIVHYKELISESDVVIFSGPMGYVEDERFATGTIELIRAAAARRLIIGGGHTIMSAEKAGALDKAYHVSTGGRAFIQIISGEDLPAVKALLLSAERFWRQ